PDGLADVEAAPMGCAGVTAFNAVRTAHPAGGGRIAVFGIGGIGHLAVQFAAAVGHEAVADARGADVEEAAPRRGADQYLARDATSAGSAPRALGGVDAITGPASATESVAEPLDGLRPRGRLVLVGVDAGSLQLAVAPMVMHALTVVGHVTGSPADTEQAMEFAVANGVRPVTQTAPLTQARTALEKLRDGEARFRLVLET